MTREAKSLLIALAVLTSPMCAQNSPQTFDVATIRPSRPGAAGSTYSFTADHGVKVTNGTLKGLIEMAYDVRDFQILSGPGWTNSESYDIVAKTLAPESDSASGTTANSVQQTRLLLQALLTERFQLKIHRESRDLPEYLLVVAKSGQKMKANSTSPASSIAGINAACGQMTGTNTTMANLAYKLSRALDRPVVDRTQLSANYDFALNWTPDTGPCAASIPSSSAPTSTNSVDGPSIFTAIQEQLGLTLESVRGPVDTLVIDHVERPSPN
jgi:bla regulator protein blaR1